VNAGTATLSGNLTLNGGTANGVLYLNGSKVATSGTALVFDGTNLGVGTTSPGTLLDLGTSTGQKLSLYRNASIRYGFAIETDTLRYYVPTGASNAVHSFGAISTTDGTTYTERMRLTSSVLSTDSSINVGIGTASPGYKLDVNTTGGSAATARLIGNDQANVRLRLENGGSGGRTWELVGGLPGANNANFSIRDVTGSTTPLTIDSSGNLGIGTTSPASKLDVRSGYITGGTASAPNGSKLLANFYTSGAIATWGAEYSNGGPIMGYGVWPSTSAASSFVSSTAIAAARGAYTIVGAEHKWFSGASQTVAIDSAVTTTQAMTLDASGNLIVGGTSPVISGAGRGNITINGSSTAVMALSVGGSAKGWVYHDNTNFEINAGSSGAMIMYTAGTERARITAGGYFKASNSGTYLSSTASYHEFYQSANAQALRVYASDSSTYNNDVLTVDGERTTTNSTYNLGNFRNGNGTGQCIIRDSGNIVNTNSSYGAISDQKLKQDIVDAASQWDDIKGVRVRKFRYKTDSTAPLQIGVIAQELEQVSPGLVDEAPDYEEVEVTDEEGNVTTERQPTGTSTKSVKYSILYMKAVKALQEAMARIEQLEADMAALKGAK
jgi:hypothetical protein